MTNEYYNHDDPFTAGSTVRSDAANSKFDAIETAFESVEADFDRAVLVPEGAANNISGNAITRAGKVIGFDSNGDLTTQSGVGRYLGGWTTSTIYSLRDIVKDTAGAVGTNNLYICATAHTSTNLASDIAKWALLVDVAGVEAMKDAAAVSASAAAADALSTAADVISTNADALSTAADVISTNADALSTAADVITVNNNLALAQDAQDAAELAYETFEEKFLGAKTSDPTLDNNGDALTDGAMYFNTTLEVLKVYNLSGTNWLQIGNYTHPNHTGAVTSIGDGVMAISSQAVTLDKIVHIATNSFIGRDTDATGTPEVLSVNTVRSMLSIGNVDNTSDADKPISDATQTALDLKADTGAQVVSSAYSITSGGLITWAHGLGAKPFNVSIFGKCTTAEEGYSIGDEAELSLVSNSSSGASRSNGVTVDDTNVRIRLNNSADVFTIGHNDTGNLVGVSNGNWDLYIRASL